MNTKPPSLSANEQMFYAIVPKADRRSDDRRRKGTLARASRIIGACEVDRIEVLVTDVSATGLGIWSNLPLQSGAVYRLQIFGQRDAFVRVVRSRARNDGSYSVGARFCNAALPHAA